MVVMMMLVMVVMKGLKPFAEPYLGATANWQDKARGF